MPKKKLEEKYNDCWIYILLLVTLAILIQSVKSYTFSILNTTIGYNTLLLPGTFFIVNYICKKYDYKKAIAAISLSGVMMVSFIVVINFALGKNIMLSSMTGDFCGYVVSHFINLLIYEFLLNNTRSPYYLIFLTYLFSIIVYYMVYTLIHLNLVILDGYWTRYFITIFIELIICIPVSFIDKQIKRGN